MNTLQSSESLPRSRILCREVDGQLVLRLPPSRRRALSRLGGIVILFVFLTGSFLVARYVLEIPLAVVSGIGIVGLILFLTAVAAMAAPYCTTTVVLITRDRVVVKTLLYGKERLREFVLDPQSRARQWHYPPTPSRRSNPDYSGPQGIEIGDAPGGSVEGNDLVVISDLSDENNPRFGGGLSKGELDWVVWRINQYLVKTRSTDITRSTTRTDEFQGTPVPPPSDTKIRIMESPFETRITFPNSVQTRSFSGILSVLLGLAILVYPLYRILQWVTQQDGERISLTPGLFILAILSLLGLAELLKGLTRLLGLRVIQISPENITYRTKLFGLGLPFKLPTEQVISVGTPRGASSRQKNTRCTQSIARTTGCVIRTSDRELIYSEAVQALSNEETAWIIGEIARRVEAARCARPGVR